MYPVKHGIVEGDAVAGDAVGREDDGWCRRFDREEILVEALEGFRGCGSELRWRAANGLGGSGGFGGISTGKKGGCGDWEEGGCG